MKSSPQLQRLRQCDDESEKRGDQGMTQVQRDEMMTGDDAKIERDGGDESMKSGKAGTRKNLSNQKKDTRERVSLMCDEDGVDDDDEDDLSDPNEGQEGQHASRSWFTDAEKLCLEQCARSLFLVARAGQKPSNTGVEEAAWRRRRRASGGSVGGNGSSVPGGTGSATGTAAPAPTDVMVARPS